MKLLENKYSRLLKSVCISFIICLVAVSTLSAQSKTGLKRTIAADSVRLLQIFQDIHANPELGFMEARTAAIIEKELRNLGYEVTSGIGRTGVTGIFRNGSGSVVLFRADMDANSVKEETGLSYASNKIVKKADGTETAVMHACGHDAHMVWLLGVAKQMMLLKAGWKGTLILLAQPAEELLQGAVAMVKDGLYDKIPEPDFMFSMHTWPSVTGTVMNGVGVRAAGSDQIDIVFHGITSHGSTPERSRDPVVMASAAIQQYQSIISRSVSPRETAVLTVSSVHGGTDYNIIPDAVALKLNLRWFNNKTREIILNGIRSINEGIAHANNISKDKYPELIIKGTAVPLINDTVLTRRINSALGKVIDHADILTDKEPIMGSEDFPFLKPANKKTRSDYMFLGIAAPEFIANAKARGEEYPFFHHGPKYQVDPAAIPFGVLIGTVAVLEIFGSKID